MFCFCAWVNWGGPWALRATASLSWRCHQRLLVSSWEKDFKDRQCSGITTKVGKFIRVEVYSWDVRMGEMEKANVLGGSWVSVFFLTVVNKEGKKWLSLGMEISWKLCFLAFSSLFDQGFPVTAAATLGPSGLMGFLRSVTRTSLWFPTAGHDFPFAGLWVSC